MAAFFLGYFFVISNVRNDGLIIMYMTRPVVDYEYSYEV
jgi:hypothetical protein